MKVEDEIKKDIILAEKRVLELNNEDNLKRLSEAERYKISNFFKEKSRHRLETAKLVFNASKNPESKKLNHLLADYNDYSEAVGASYYSMYYIFQAFLAQEYSIKLREGIRGVHEKTMHLIVYYLVKTKKLAKHLYEEYITTLKLAAEVQKLSLENFQEKAYKYAKDYDKSRSNREIFTYTVTSSIEESAAKRAIDIADEFINTIKQLMIKK